MSYYIVRHGPCYTFKIRAMSVCYAVDNKEEATRALNSFNEAAQDLCKYYLVVAENYEDAEAQVKEKVENNS